MRCFCLPIVILEAHRLAKRFGHRRVLQDASLSVAAGELVGIAGGNGAGKSTLLNVLAGLLAPDAGALLTHTAIGYAPQSILLYEHLTVAEHFRYFAAARPMPRSWHDAGRELASRYRFEAWWEERAGNLSEGTKQKLNLSLALMHEPGLLLLDEPYAGFDWETYLLFWEHAAEFQRAGRAVVVVSHLFYDRARFTRLLQLADGRLAEVARA